MAGVFISYRRSDVAGHAGRLYERLAARFGHERVFMDVDSLDPGQHFDVEIQRKLSDADVVLALIGPKWDLQRLNDPNDWVRTEIAMALRLERCVIPVFIDGTPVLSADVLPADIKGLMRAECTEIRHASFPRDVDDLIAKIDGRFVKPDPAFDGRRLVDSMSRAGWPYSWFAPLVRGVGPRLALAGLACMLAAGWAATLGASGWFSWDMGYEKARIVESGNCALEVDKAREAGLIFKGRVKDRTDRDVDDASVIVTNSQNGKQVKLNTTQLGRFTADLKKVDISESAIIQLEVIKSHFKVYRDEFVFREGFEHRSVLDPLPPDR